MAGAEPVEAARKNLFRKSTDGNGADLPAAEFTDFEDKPTASDRVLVSEMMTTLREEVKKIEETDWMYEGTEAHAVVKLRT